MASHVRLARVRSSVKLNGFALGPGQRDGRATSSHKTIPPPQVLALPAEGLLRAMSNGVVDPWRANYSPAAVSERTRFSARSMLPNAVKELGLFVTASPVVYITVHV